MSQKDKPMTLAKIQRAKERVAWAKNQKERLLRLGQEALAYSQEIKDGHKPLPKGVASAEEAQAKIEARYLSEVRIALEVVSGQNLLRAIAFCEELASRVPFVSTSEFLKMEEKSFRKITERASENKNPPIDASTGFSQLLHAAWGVKDARQAKAMSARIKCALDNRHTRGVDAYRFLSLIPFLSRFYENAQSMPKSVVSAYEKFLLKNYVQHAADVCMRKGQPSLDPRHPNGMLTIVFVRNLHDFVENGQEPLFRCASTHMTNLYTRLKKEEPEIYAAHVEGYIASSRCSPKVVALINAV